MADFQRSNFLEQRPTARKLVAWTLTLMLTASGVTTTSVPAAAQASVFSPAQTSRLDSEFRSILKTHVLPSVAVGVWRPGKRPYLFVDGAADLRSGAARRFAQPFRIASITKAFVAVAVLQLVEAGKLRKTDRISRWYPRFPNARFITIDDLLRMRSGIAAPDDSVVLASVYDRPLGSHPTVAEQIAESTNLRAQFVAPNTIGAYTDLNYFMLGEIVLRATGRGIGYHITRGIIDRLRLTNTFYPTEPVLAGGLHGYGWNPATRHFDDKTLFNPALAGAAGAMISSMDDLHTYARAVCLGGLLSPAMQRSMLAGQPLGDSKVLYGEGVISSNEYCGHSGTINGFNSDMYYFPKTDTTVIIDVNRLDKDNHARTTPYLDAIFRLLTAPSGSK